MPKQLYLFIGLTFFLTQCKTEKEALQDSAYATEIGTIVSILQTQTSSLLAFSLHQENEIYPIYFDPQYLDSSTNDGNGTHWTVESKDYLERRDQLKTFGKSNFYGTSLVGLQQDTVRLAWNSSDSFFVATHSGMNRLIGGIQLIHKSGLYFNLKYDIKILNQTRIIDLKGSLELRIEPKDFKYNYFSGREYNGSLLYQSGSTQYLIDLVNTTQVAECNTLANSGEINLYEGSDFLGYLELDPFSDKAWDFTARFSKANTERIISCW